MTTIAKLRELLERATPGPWESLTPPQHEATSRHGAAVRKGIDGIADVVRVDHLGSSTEANAALIAAAVNALPRLLAVAEAAEEMFKERYREEWDVQPLLAALAALEEP